MDFDDILFGLILCGIGLAVACFRSEFVLLRELRAAERRMEGVIRDLKLKRALARADESDQVAQTETQTG